jgi:hypothetical protein
LIILLLSARLFAFHVRAAISWLNSTAICWASTVRNLSSFSTDPGIDIEHSKLPLFNSISYPLTIW